MAVRRGHEGARERVHSSVLATFSPTTPQAVITWLMLAVLLAAVASVSVVGDDAPSSNVLKLASGLLAFLAVAVRAVRERHQRVAWAVVAVALLPVVGSVFYRGFVNPGGAASWPGTPELARLVYIVLGYVAVMLHLQTYGRRWYGGMWVDGLAAGFAAAAVSAEVVIGAAYHVERPALELAALLLYPVGDLFFLSLLAVCAVVLGWRTDPQMRIVGLGVIVLVVTDLGSFFSMLQHETPWEGPRDALGALVASCIITTGAGLFLTSDGDHRREPPSSESQHLVTTVVPGLAAVVALGLLLPLPGHNASQVTHYLALGALVAVGIRSILAHRDLWRLFSDRQESRTDELTGLLNRRGFYERVNAFLEAEAAAGRDPRGALAILDLDEFKEINDSLGHHAGDQLLARLAQRLRDNCTIEDVIMARLGGDEMAIFLVNGEVAELAATRIGLLLKDPFEVEGVNVMVTASIGIACSPQSGVTLPELLRCADIAMYQAKGARIPYVIHDPGHPDMEREDRLTRVAELRAAVAHDPDQLVLHYQPKVDLSTGRTVGVEALLRWQHPERGLIFPDGFLPLAETAGLMPHITDIVLTQALTQVAAWRTQGIELSVAVNVPSAAIVDHELPERVTELLGTHRLTPRDLTLEITEETLLEDRVRARVVMASMRAIGVSISIDDYGTGYSSLAYLRELPVDELKLDRSFISPMNGDDRAAAIVRSTIDLAHSLGLVIVAEGVEDGDAAHRLRNFGCDRVQGYHYSRPLPPDRLTEWISENDLLLATVPSQG